MFFFVVIVKQYGSPSSALIYTDTTDLSRAIRIRNNRGVLATWSIEASQSLVSFSMSFTPQHFIHCGLSLDRQRRKCYNVTVVYHGCDVIDDATWQSQARSFVLTNVATRTSVIFI